MSDGLVGRLAAALDARIVLGGLAERLQWASDASIYRLVPRVVVLARNAEDVRAAMMVAAAEGVPVCFRAGGTSLSGQAVTDGVLIVVSRSLRAIRVLDDGKAVACQPGAIGGTVNAVLSPHGRRIGPDPASMQAAEIGGIVANNASGMCCGVAENSYRTVTGLDLILADGWRIDTADSDADARLLAERPAIANGLLELRREILAHPTLPATIAKAFATKNTVGYSLNAFLDAVTPAAILQRLVVGSEGTLAFIAEATLRTVPLAKHRATAWLLFRDAAAAGAAVAPLAEAGAAAIEILDAVALRRVAAKLPDPLPAGQPAALLIEFQETNADVLGFRLAAAKPILDGCRLEAPAAFTADPALQARYWSIRKGLFPSVGAIRAAGTAVVIEDVTFPVAGLARGIEALRALFNLHGYDDAVIFGHAKDGNLHFTLTPDFSRDTEVSRYGRFMQELVDLVLAHGGHLKAEHGTGRNMAPFVERQWGAEAVALMRRVKALLDPRSLLNPGVLLADDPLGHLHHLKTLPKVDDLVDKCIECGFCEPVCPSRDATWSPRQRIAMLRVLAGGTRPERAAVAAAWRSQALDSCAADGMCSTACPVSIDTGALVKAERARLRTPLQRKAAALIERHFSVVVSAARLGLRWARIFGDARIPGSPLRLPRAAPPLPRSWPHAAPDAPTVVYFPTCLARTFGGDSLPQLLSVLCERAGIGLVVPGGISGLCCGQPFATKGFPEAYRAMSQRTVAALAAAVGKGGCTVVTDTSTCSAQLAKPLADAGLRILDPATFTAEMLIPRLRAADAFAGDLPALAVHPTCSEQQHGWSSKLAAAAGAKALLPRAIACCGMAGDKGWTLPSLTAAATAAEAAEVRAGSACAGVATSATCSAALSAATGLDYRHLWHWLHASLRN